MMPGRTKRKTERSLQVGAGFAAEGNFDSLVSAGSGSVMDTCEAANLCSTYPPDHFLACVNALIGVVESRRGAVAWAA